MTNSGPSAKYVEMLEQDGRNNGTSSLDAAEIAKLKRLLGQIGDNDDFSSLAKSPSVDSDYPEFHESTHAWAVFADDPQKRAGPMERIVGVLIIAFQLVAYGLFAAEAIEDFQDGQVPVMISHKVCFESDEEVDVDSHDLVCEASFTNTLDAFVAYFMLSIFLASDMLQAFRAIRSAYPLCVPTLFACFAALEVVCAFVAASIAVSYNLFIGEVTDAVEVGVGLLFIRELSQKTYSGIRHGNTKQYRMFFTVLAILLTAGMIMDPLCALIFAGYVQ